MPSFILSFLAISVDISGRLALKKMEIDRGGVDLGERSRERV